MRRTGKAVIILSGAFACSPALAQSPPNPSAEQIIQALKPVGPVSNTTRGIVPLPPGPGAGASTPAPQAPAATPKAAAKTPAEASARIGQVPHRAAPAVVPAPAAKPPSIDINVEFATGSAKLTPEARGALDQLGQALANPALAAYHFQLVGHTDTTGTPAANLALSDARAKVVARYVESKFHIDPSRIDAYGVGEKDLLVPTGPDTSNQANRRVQIINTGK